MDLKKIKRERRSLRFDFYRTVNVSHSITFRKIGKIFYPLFLDFVKFSFLFLAHHRGENKVYPRFVVRINGLYYHKYILIRQFGSWITNPQKTAEYQSCSSGTDNHYDEQADEVVAHFFFHSLPLMPSFETFLQGIKLIVILLQLITTLLQFITHFLQPLYCPEVFSFPFYQSTGILRLKLRNATGDTREGLF